MITVFKYPIEIVTHQQVSCPKGAQPLHVGLDPQDQPCLWMQVDTDNPPQDLTVYLIGTGHRLPDAAKVHVGSFVDDAFVWHVFVGKSMRYES